MGVKITGMDNLMKKLNNLEKNASSLNGTHSIPFSELFNQKFMGQNSNFATIDEFAEKSNFDFSDLESIDEKKLDTFVNENSDFDSWDSMKSKATEEWTAKKLGL